MSTKASHKISFTFIFLLLFIAVGVSPRKSIHAADTQKLTVAEVIAKHLKSIGSPTDIAAAKTRIVAGTSLFTQRSPGTGQNSGLSILFSEGNKTAIAMTFANPTYPHEKFGFDGQNLFISFAKPGVRSTLGEFVFHRTEIIKEGLAAGTLSTTWPLLNWTGEKGKLEYAGTKKVDNKEAYVLRYLPKKGSELKISLYFDAETFHHIKTEYAQTQATQMAATPDASKEGVRELHYELEELFSDFKPEGNLTLPHNYKMKLMLESTGRTYIADWEMVFSKFSFNQPLEVAWFDVNAAAAN